MTPTSPDLQELRRRQVALAAQVRLQPLPRLPATVAGVDAAFAGEKIVAVAVLFDFATLTPLEHAWVVERPALPYIPGLLSFREGPHLAAAVRKLSKRPELLVVDGQGIAHPKRFGLACHLGVELALPAIGCAKSRLIGEFHEPAEQKGSHSPLFDQGELVGTVLRTRSRVRPVFVSPGHLVSLDQAAPLILRCTTLYRLPEPQREADRLAAEIKGNLPPAERDSGAGT